MLFRCFYCPDFFWDVHKLIKHRNMHIDVEYKCEICEHIFWNREILYSHVAQSHFKKRWGVTEGKFTCDICNKDFATKWSITSHMLQHTSELIMQSILILAIIELYFFYFKKNLILCVTNVAGNF